MNYRRKEIKALIASSNTYLVFIYLVFSFVQDKAAKAPTRRLQSGIQFIQFSFQSKYLAWLQALGRYACGIWISLLLLSIKSAGKLKFSKIKESGKVQLEEGASFDLFFIDLFTIDLASFDIWSFQQMIFGILWTKMTSLAIFGKRANTKSWLYIYFGVHWERMGRDTATKFDGGYRRRAKNAYQKTTRAHIQNASSYRSKFFEIVCSHTTPQSWWRISERCLSIVGNFQVHNRF